MFERILIPLDGSELARAILTQVRRLLVRADSEVVLVRAVSVPRGLETGAVELEEILQAQAAKYLDKVVGELTSQGARARGLVRAGSAAEVILDAAAEERATLIAMSSHGRSGLPRWTLGSVAEKVVRASRLPVLVLRSFANVAGTPVETGAREVPVRRILLPTDGSPASAAAAAAAEKFARLFEAEILVLHAEMPFAFPGTDWGALPAPLATPSESDPATAGIADRLRRAGLRVERQTTVGDPAGVILDQVRERRADLVAMATHGRSGASRWLLGSVAERVLRHADVPLLLVRASAKEPEGERLREKEASLP